MARAKCSLGIYLVLKHTGEIIIINWRTPTSEGSTSEHQLAKAQLTSDSEGSTSDSEGSTSDSEAQLVKAQTSEHQLTAVSDLPGHRSILLLQMVAV